MHVLTEWLPQPTETTAAGAGLTADGVCRQGPAAIAPVKYRAVSHVTSTCAP